MTRDGRLVAQDIEVVMDGGAYCTLTPVVLSRGALHAGGPYRCPNVRIRARATADQHAAERRVPRLRRAADRVRRRDAPQPDRRGARRSRRSRSARRNVYRAGRHDADRPGPARQRRRRGGPRAGRRGRRVRAPARADRGRRGDARRLRHDPGSALRTGRERSRPASGWRWPGTAPGSPVRARSSSRRSPRSS